MLNCSCWGTGCWISYGVILGRIYCRVTGSILLVYKKIELSADSEDLHIYNLDLLLVFLETEVTG